MIAMLSPAKNMRPAGLEGLALTQPALLEKTKQLLPLLQAMEPWELESKLKSLFEQTCIERVTATKQKDFVRIYLTSDRLIQKEDIFTVEKEIKKQLFSGCNITIKIYEK